MYKKILISSVFRSLSVAGLVIIGAQSVSCQQKVAPEKPVESITTTGTWADQMQNLADVLSQLIPFVNSTGSFNNSENYKVIDENIDKLTKLSHKINTKKNLPDADPSINMISTQFEDEIRRAADAIKLGHRDYARHLLKSSTSYCIQCHTRNSSGPSFTEGRFSRALATMNPLDRGEFFAATRQFDKALDEYKSVLQTQPGKGYNVIAWERSARHSLAIAVRFMNNPSKAEEIAQLIINSPNSPVFLREDAIHWKKTIVAWKKDKTGYPANNSLAISRAKKYIERAQKIQEYSTDHAGDIHYLQATALLHDILSRGLKDSEKSEALYLIGTAYDSLRDLNFWTLHEQYYEACIKASPGTAISAKCFRKYEESILFGFSGSAGFVLPADVQLKLSELRALAISSTKK